MARTVAGGSGAATSPCSSSWASLPWLDGLTYVGYALGISALSWIMVPLFLAGITGVVRQK